MEVFDSTISENILMSNRLFEHLPKLLRRIESTNPHTRALGYLVAGALLKKISGEHQIDTAKTILDVMNLAQIQGIEYLLPKNDQFAEVCPPLYEQIIVCLYYL